MMMASRRASALSARWAATPLRSSLRIVPPTRTLATSPARLANLATFQIPKVSNEPNHHYAKDSEQRKGLVSALEDLQSRLPLEVPLVIAGEKVTSTKIATQSNPSAHGSAVATYSLASGADVGRAIDGALAAKASWEALPFADRAAVFLKAADLVSTKYRYELMAATMLGQGKNAWQAEIDAAAELALNTPSNESSPRKAVQPHFLTSLFRIQNPTSITPCLARDTATLRITRPRKSAAP
jgi:1-pyrroline-5-carboxylate dehydrogenase